MRFETILGIDVGGSGIKGAPVNSKNGKLLSDRYRIPTPNPATPENVAKTIKKIANHFKWEGSIGVGFPAVVLNGVVKTATNIDKSWIGVDARKIISEKTNLPVHVVNDADAAGLAEVRFGAGKKENGTIVLITVGTGIGTAVFTKRRLVSNTELGQVFLANGLLAEKYAADSIRQNESLEWKEWGRRFNWYLKEVEKLFWPKLIIVGGGVSKKPENFMSVIDISTKIKMAKQKNEAGIIGAAMSVKANKSEVVSTFKKLKKKNS